MPFRLMKEHPDSPKVIAHPPFIFGAGFLAGVLLNYWAGLSFGVGEMTKIGWLFVAGGMGIAGWAAWSLSRAGTGIPTHLPATALVTAGPYLTTRNPIYIGLTLAYLGLASLLDAPLTLAVLPFVLAVLHKGVVLREEAYLETKFGEPYREYMARTKRYF